MSAPLTFNPPPGWPRPPAGWIPPRGWQPDPKWPPPPAGWALWIPSNEIGAPAAQSVCNAPIMTQVATPGGASSVAARLQVAEAENVQLRARMAALEASRRNVICLSDEHVLQDAGIYRYHHPLESAIAYRERLADTMMRVAEAIRSGTAIEMSDTFTYDGSLAKGRAMTGDLARLMLRAYNAEAENVVRCMRVGTSQTAIQRLDAARAAIATLGKMMQMRISDAFHALRLEEIRLTADYLMKKEEEKEAARAERERLREERKVAQELTIAREKLEKERVHILTVLARLQEKGESDVALEQQLRSVDAAIAQNDFRATNIRAGYVYVISNRGAFGQHVMKIGLTRRLKPLERIHELGDASVPFHFDVHVLYYSDDAVSLERQLHAHFSDRRMNRSNDRKEFFFATPEEVRLALSGRVGALLDYASEVDATEYFQSVNYWPSEHRRSEASWPMLETAGATASAERLDAFDGAERTLSDG